MSLTPRTLSRASMGSEIDINDRINELQMRYTSTVEVITEHFEKEVTPQQVTKKLHLLPTELKHHRVYLRVNDSDRENRFDEIINATDFRHVEILEHLVHELGDENSKKAMTAYRRDLNHFKAHTALSEFAEWTGFNNESEKEAIVLKMGKKWEDKSLHDFEEFKTKLQQRAHFSDYDLQVSKVEISCVQITLTFVPNSADIGKMNPVDARFFKENHILRVTVGDTVLYDVEFPKVHTYIIMQIQ